MPPSSPSFREALDRLVKEGALEVSTKTRGEKHYTIKGPKKITVLLGKEAEVIPLNPNVLGHWYLLFTCHEEDLWTLRTEVTRGKSSSDLASTSSSSTSTSTS